MEVPIDVLKSNETTATLDGTVLLNASVISEEPTSKASDAGVALLLATATLDVLTSTVSASDDDDDIVGIDGENYNFYHPVSY